MKVALDATMAEMEASRMADHDTRMAKWAEARRVREAALRAREAAWEAEWDAWEMMAAARHGSLDRTTATDNSVNNATSAASNNSFDNAAPTVTDNSVVDATPISFGANAGTPGKGPSLDLTIEPATPLYVNVPSLGIPPTDVWVLKDRVAPNPSHVGSIMWRRGRTGTRRAGGLEGGHGAPFHLRTPQGWIQGDTHPRPSSANTTNVAVSRKK